METEKIKKYNRGGRALGGLIVVAVGVILLLKQMSIVIFPSWLFTWPMFLIVLGFYIGVRHGFRGWGGWLICIFIGSIFLVKDYFPEYHIADYIWPIAFIVAGAYMIFRPRRCHDWESMHYRHRQRYWKSKKYGDFSEQNNPAPGETRLNDTVGQASDDDYIDSTSVFGGVNKVVVSKNFKGGDIVNIFGGCEINLTQADFTGTVTLDIVQIFGGAKITVPTDWKIIIKTTSVFGGVEDKRPPALIKENPAKTLVIDGTSIFAGVSIQCY
jgi:predicted membrane protein